MPCKMQVIKLAFLGLFHPKSWIFVLQTGTRCEHDEFYSLYLEPQCITFCEQLLGFVLKEMEIVSIWVVRIITYLNVESYFGDNTSQFDSRSKQCLNISQIFSHSLLLSSAVFTKISWIISRQQILFGKTEILLYLRKNLSSNQYHLLIFFYYCLQQPIYSERPYPTTQIIVLLAFKSVQPLLAVIRVRVKYLWTFVIPVKQLTDLPMHHFFINSKFTVATYVASRTSIVFIEKKFLDVGCSFIVIIGFVLFVLK